jgi:hypothetical protein
MQGVRSRRARAAITDAILTATPVGPVDELGAAEIGAQAVIRVRSSYTGGNVGTPKNRERRDVDLISDVVELLTGWRDEDDRSVGDLVLPARKSRRPSRLLSSFGVTSIPRWWPPRYDAWADAGEEDIPQLQAHVRAARTGERGSGHVAFTPPRPLITQRDHRHLRPLGTRGTEAPGGKDAKAAFPV